MQNISTSLFLIEGHNLGRKLTIVGDLASGTIQLCKKYTEHLVRSYVNRNARSISRFWPEQQTLARNGGFVKFWMFKHMLALFHRLPLKVRVFNGLRRKPELQKARAHLRKNTGSEWVLIKERTSKIVHNYGLI
jgi:hypothetical protein